MSRYCSAHYSLAGNLPLYVGWRKIMKMYFVLTKRVHKYILLREISWEVFVYNFCAYYVFIWRAKCLPEPFCLTSGETGIGKSALMSSLFNTNFEDSPSTHFLSSVRLRAQTCELQESNVLLKLTIVKTVGFGDQMNKADR